MYASAVPLNMLRMAVIARSLTSRSFSTVQPTPVSSSGSTNSGSWSERRLHNPTKVPQQPHRATGSVINTEQKQSPIAINQQTVRLLERLSLVDLDNKEALQTLQDSIEFASRILPIETDGVEPLYSVLEQEKLALRPDTITDGNIQAEVLQNATITEEEYFVAPPGNIPLEQPTERS